MEYKIYKTDDELIHWGIKGMKWGQRRYQNKDGSLTPAGQKRYQKEMAALKKEEQVLKNRKATQAKINRLEAKRKSIEDQKKALDDGDNAHGKKSKSTNDIDSKKSSAKSIKDMTDEELATAINRARMEDAYRQLRPEQTSKKNQFMNKMLNEVVAPAAINSGKKFLEDALTKVGKNLLGDKVDPNSVEALKSIKDKLQLQAEINKYKDPDSQINWENKLKKQQYEENAKKAAESAKTAKKAEEDAKKAEKEAKKDAKKAEKEAKKEAKKAEKEAEKESKKSNDGDTDDGDSGKTSNAANDEFVKRANEDSSSERVRKNVDDNIDWDDWDSADDRKVFTGTVEGEGRSSKSADRGKKWVDDNDIIDAEPYALATTTNVRNGQSYLADHWDDYVWVDDD